MKDGLEKLFYKYLHRQLPEEEDWNTPSDEVWLHVEKALHKGEDRRRPFLLLWLAIGLLFLGLVLVLYHVNHLQTEVREVHENRRDVADLSSERQEGVSAEEKEHLARLPQAGPSSSVPGSMSRSGLESAVRQHKEPLQEPGKVALEDLSDEALSHLAKAETNSKSDASPSELSRQAGSRKPKALPALPFGGEGELFSSGERLLPLRALVFQKDGEEEDRFASPFFLQPYAGLSETFAPVKGRMSNGFEAMVKSDKAMPSLHLAVDVGWKMGKAWGVFTGLRYRSVKLWSFSKVQAVFDASGEVSDVAGFMKSSQRFYIPSSVGMMEKEIALRYPSSLGIQSGDLLEGEVEVVNGIQLFQFPLGVVYERPLSASFSLFARVGIAWNQVWQAEARLLPAVSYQGYSMQVEEPEQIEIFFPDYWSMSGDVSVLYRLAPSYSLAFRLGYYRELRPHFQLIDMHSRLSGLDFSLGIFYRF